MWKHAQRSMVFLISMIAIAVGGVACSGTRAAYEAAGTLEAKAYVVTEHYAAVLTEANVLIGGGNVPNDVITAIQAAERVATPKIRALRQAAETFAAVKSADSEQALASALNDAATALSSFINSVKQARSQ